MREGTVVRLLWAASALGILGVGLAIRFPRERSTAPLPQALTGEVGGEASIVWLGDTMLGDAAADSLARHGYGWALREVVPLLSGGFVVANAEAPFTTRTQALDLRQPWNYNTDPAALPALRSAGVRALGLANNHAMDRGAEGIRDTYEHARRAGVVAFGAGMNEAEAERPFLIRSPVGTVGVVALANPYGRSRSASRRGAGTLATTRARIRRGYRLARSAGADWVVAYVHWGENYADVTAEQRLTARLFAEEGYTLVVGHHPHVVQPLQVVGATPVIYSLGNFVFGARGRFDAFGKPGIGLILTSRFSRRGLARLVLRCIVTDNRRVGFRPRPCTQLEAQRWLPGLAAGARVAGDSLVVTLGAPGTRPSTRATPPPSAP
jgi:hypothetical protein